MKPSIKGTTLTFTVNPLLKIRGVANYQFGGDIGESLFPDECKIQFSRRTGRIRYISIKEKLLAVIRARDGRIVLTFWGAQRLHQATQPPRHRVMIRNEISPFITKGRSVFAKHVIQVDPQLRARDEALIVDQDDKLLAVGKTYLCPQEMLDLTRGTAVRIRHTRKSAGSS
ncbi:MAG: PUA domain-containing protein [Promethearchaeota archaeon]